ncbi:MAG: cell wall hydrolase, partial [Proteobacteria bacterium]|nr:cell wall hydrolase [Pseudomonadota bacterium]
MREIGKFTGHGATGPGVRRGALWMGLFAFAAGLVTASPGAAGVSDEIECLALNIYFEARSEPDAGRLAVGHVVMNRVSDRRYPGKVCAVVRQGGEKVRNRCQFSWWCDGRSDRPKDEHAWKKSKAIATRIYWGLSEDITEGALWYHAVYVRPAWRKVLVPARTIGRHIFYRDAASVQAAARTGEDTGNVILPADKA